MYVNHHNEIGTVKTSACVLTSQLILGAIVCPLHVRETFLLRA